MTKNEKQKNLGTKKTKKRLNLSFIFKFNPQSFNYF